MGFFLGTTFFILLELLFLGWIRATTEAHKRSLKVVLYSTSVVCCWLFWALVYIAQTHPLVRPVPNNPGEE